MSTWSSRQESAVRFGSLYETNISSLAYYSTVSSGWIHHNHLFCPDHLRTRAAISGICSDSADSFGFGLDVSLTVLSHAEQRRIESGTGKLCSWLCNILSSDIACHPRLARDITTTRKTSPSILPGQFPKGMPPSARQCELSGLDGPHAWRIWVCFFWTLLFHLIRMRPAKITLSAIHTATNQNPYAIDPARAGQMWQ